MACSGGRLLDAEQRREWPVGRIGAMMSSFTGATIIQTGAGAYIGALAISMAITAAEMAIVRNHVHGFGARR